MVVRMGHIDTVDVDYDCHFTCQLHGRTTIAHSTERGVRAIGEVGLPRCPVLSYELRFGEEKERKEGETSALILICLVPQNKTLEHVQQCILRSANVNRRVASDTAWPRFRHRFANSNVATYSPNTNQ